IVTVLAKYENQINVFSEFLEDIPDTDEPVWILGAYYNVKTGNMTSAVFQFMLMLYLWAVGGTGPSSDTGWGCMLRCGQMILAQALVCRHLGRDWRRVADGTQPVEYQRILHCFLDRKDSCYSIHQMAQMGVGEGKSFGEWYGPNTVAQVLKKLALFDDWNSLAVYVSMDNTVVIEDISTSGQRQVPFPFSHSTSRSQQPLDWRPLLLLIPLRMGINNINPIYIQALKECFKMPQSCGVLGGKPNLAYYFIGFIDDELIYLDPHTTQSAVDSEMGTAVDDQSYHCQRNPRRMKITSLDPSVALGFFCKSEEDFDSWCNLVQQEILKKRNLRMFELVEKHPSHWPPFVPPTKPEVQTTGAGGSNVLNIT
uniref:Cysteine protease n=1 Tax=Astyanax mexicanus TaxID=7994 RepID=W5LLX4_ASTMX